MPNKVVKLAQPGFDAKTTGDENLIYSSDWPLLKIYEQGSFTIPDITKACTIVPHDLHFTPLFWFYSNLTIDAWTGNGALTNTRRAEFYGPIGNNGFLGIDDNKLSYTPFVVPSVTGSVKLYYYIFALDLLTPFQAPIVNVGGAGGGVSKTVFKIAKPSKDISSKSMDDYVIHSNARSPLIHSVTPATTTANPDIVAGYGTRVYHNLGYVPMYFGFIYNPTYNIYVQIPAGGSAGFFANESYVQYGNTVGGEKISIVILKDPFTIDYSVQVTI